MKQGKSLTELAQELERIQSTARDFMVPTKALAVQPSGEIQFKNGVMHTFQPTKYAHSQIAQYSDIPHKYYERIRIQNPNLWADSVNHGLRVLEDTKSKQGLPETRLLRTVGNTLRANLSSKFRRLDSYHLCQHVLPLLLENKMRVVSSEITEKRLYIKAFTDKIQGEIAKGDVIQYGLCITNSDVGAGALKIEPMTMRLVCTNGMIANTASRHYHVGKNQAEMETRELLTAETLAADDKAFWLKVRDLVTHSMSQQGFENELNRLREANGLKIENFNVPEVVELAMEAVNVNGEDTKNNIIAYLANGADGAGLTKWGLANAFTYAAQSEHVDYDSSTDLERAGSAIIDLNEKQWKRVAC